MKLKELMKEEHIPNKFTPEVAADMYRALEGLIENIDRSKWNVKKDFRLMNAHAYATKVLLHARGK